MTSSLSRSITAQARVSFHCPFAITEFAIFSSDPETDWKKKHSSNSYGCRQSDVTLTEPRSYTFSIGFALRWKQLKIHRLHETWQWPITRTALSTKSRTVTVMMLTKVLSAHRLVSRASVLNLSSILCPSVSQGYASTRSRLRGAISSLNGRAEKTLYYQVISCLPVEEFNDNYVLNRDKHLNMKPYDRCVISFELHKPRRRL